MARHKRNAENGTHRLNLEVPIETYREWEELQKSIGAASMTETLRRSVRTLGEINRLQQRGSRLMVRSPRGEAEVLKFIV